MYPRIELGPLTLYTYGLMVALGLAVALGLLCLELRRKGLDPSHGLLIALAVVPSGVVGAKILFVIEEWDRFVVDPVRVALSGAGLSFYGAFVLGALALYAYLRLNGIGFLVFADAAAPGALLGRGIARLGCHLSGDGDYGLPTALPWGTDYSRGIYPPSAALARLPHLTRDFPGGIAPDDLAMHPTGVYEFLISALLFAVLWRYRRHLRPDGRVFMLYLAATGAIRFGLEFVALEPPLALGLTEAQLISCGLIAIGVVGVGQLKPRPISRLTRRLRTR